MRWTLLVVALLLGLAAPATAEDTLGDVVLILDPGHGDRASVHGVPADPGAIASSLHGEAAECVFTWDTSMRVRRRALARGARVFLTLADPQGDYEPHRWSPDGFPLPGSSFRYKTLVERPEPATVQEALAARVETANRLYGQYRHDADVYFVSLHFDSTAPHLAGASFYHPGWEGGRTGFIGVLEDEFRRAGRARRDLRTGDERGLSQPGSYSVLARSENPDSYLIELGNLRSADGSDLWRMRDARVREEYAAIVVRALENRLSQGGRVSPARGGMAKRTLAAWAFVLACLAAAGLGVWSLRRSRPAYGRSTSCRPSSL